MLRRAHCAPSARALAQAIARTSRSIGSSRARCATRRSSRYRAISPRESSRASSASSRGANESVEMWLERGLVALLLLAGAAALIVYNGDWLRELSFSVPERRCTPASRRS